MTRPTLAVWKLTSCDGCQVALLDRDEAVLSLGEHFDVVRFAEASSVVGDGPVDVAIVEGSVSTAAEVDRVREIRAAARTFVALGTCATTGGVQAMRNGMGLDAVAASTPLAAHVHVDVAIHGCPPDPATILDVLAAVASGRRAPLSQEAVCIECRRRGLVCVLVARGAPCLGPVTWTGCGARCPASGRGCYGCFGLLPGAALAALDAHVPGSVTGAARFDGRVEAGR